MEATLRLDPTCWELLLPRARTQRKNKDAAQDPTNGKAFGRRLARLRQAAGYSQRQLAREVGISQRMLAYYETRANKPPVHILPALAEILDVSVEVLLGTKKPPRKKKLPAVSPRLMAKMRQIEQLPKRDQQAIMRTIDAFLSRG